MAPPPENETDRQKAKRLHLEQKARSEKWMADLSIAKHVLTDVRLGMTPLMFENYLFLYFNADLWSVVEVKKAAAAERRRPEREKEDAELCHLE